MVEQKLLLRGNFFFFRPGDGPTLPPAPPQKQAIDDCRYGRNSICADGTVRRDFSISEDKSRIPIMEPHLFLLAVEVIKSDRIEQVVGSDKATLETVPFHDSLGIGRICAKRNPFPDF